MFNNNLKNITISNYAHLDTSKQLTTLGELVQKSDYLFFYIISSSTLPNPAFLQALQHLLANKSNPSASKKKNSNNSPAKLKRLFSLTSLGKKRTTSSENISSQSVEINVVVVDVEFSPNEANLSFLTDLGFYFFPSQMYLSKSYLLRTLGFVNTPSLFVVESSELKVVSQSCRAILDDREGHKFPWANPPISELFKMEMLRNSSSENSLLKVDFSTLEKGVKGLFFGAKWCPPSRVMCKQLCEIYPDVKSHNPSFEIFFCSSDRSEESFHDHFCSMPWLAFPYGCEKLLSKFFDVQGIPTLLLLDEDFSLISRNGLNLILSEPQGYPWKRKPIYELTEFTAHRLSEMPSLILFTEGSPEDAEFSTQFLGSCLEAIHCKLTQQEQSLTTAVQPGNSDSQDSARSDEKPASVAADPLQIFFTGDDPICDYVLESFGQEQADLPLLLICDVMAGHLAICDKPDVSEEVLVEFVADYRAGRSTVQPIPGQKQQIRTVGGIPTEIIEQLVSQGQPAPELARSA